MDPGEDSGREDRAGDGIGLSMTKARGAERHGAIWILVVSLSAAIIAVAGYWLLNHPQISQFALHQG